MNKLILCLLLLHLSIEARGQINLQDSSAQVISYWNIGDRYEYEISLQKLKYTGQDTSANETIYYDVEVSVVDSTENSYTVQWKYKNFKTDAINPISQKLIESAEDLTVDIQLNELGMIQSVLNWEQVRDYMADSMDDLKKELSSIPEVETLFEQSKRMYSSKEAIEAAAIQDAQQFHSFHGAKYFLNETTSAQITAPNIYDATQPFDTEVSVQLEELDAENNLYYIRSIQEVNSAQLTEAVYHYLKKSSENLGKKFMDQSALPPVRNVVETVSMIHDTGWVLESILWKEVESDGFTQMEIRTIIMK